MGIPVLLIEDEPIVRDSLKDWLSDEGYDVATAEDGEKALEIAGKQMFDIAVVDLKLPGKNGIQVLREVKARQPALKAIVMTAYPSPDTAEEALKAGAFEYLVKPFPPEELEHLIELSLVSRRAVPANAVREDEIARREQTIAASLKQGQELFKKGDVAAAIAEFSRVLEVAPGNLAARAWLRKARAGALEVTKTAGEDGEEETAGNPKPCLWAKMGVVSSRVCTRGYDCLACEFDQQMQAAGESPEIAAALEKLKTLSGAQRMCRFALRGEVSYRLCSRLFECAHCDFFQLLEDTTERKLAKLALRREALRRKQAKQIAA